MKCTMPTEPTLKDTARTWNVGANSPKGDWTKFMPWRAPGTSKPMDSCGIASGFSPDAEVQFPHRFQTSSNVKQGEKGTSDLKRGAVTKWVAGATVEVAAGKAFVRICFHIDCIWMELQPLASQLC